MIRSGSLKSCCVALLALLILALTACANEQATVPHGSASPAAPTLSTPLGTSNEAGRATGTASAVTESPVTTLEHPQTSTPTLLTSTPTSTFLPLPSLQGTLYYVHGGELVAFKTQTKQEQRTGVMVGTGLTSELQNTTGFSVSPDQRSVALLRDANLSLIRLETPEQASSLSADVGHDFVWSPDSTAIAFVTGPRKKGIYDLQICSESSKVWIADIATDAKMSVGNGCHPAWAPDGKRLAFVTHATNNMPQNALVLVNRAGENKWMPINGTLQDNAFPLPRFAFDNPMWSTDGATIYLLSRFRTDSSHSLSSIEKVDAVTGQTTAIGFADEVIAYSIRPSADSGYIAYNQGNEIGVTIFVVHEIDAGAHTVKAYWAHNEQITLHSMVIASRPHIVDGAWAPQGTLIAVLFCGNPENFHEECSFERNEGEIRVYDPLHDALSAPIIQEAAIWGGIEWRP